MCIRDRLNNDYSIAIRNYINAGYDNEKLLEKADSLYRKKRFKGAAFFYAEYGDMLKEKESLINHYTNAFISELDNKISSSSREISRRAKKNPITGRISPDDPILKEETAMLLMQLKDNVLKNEVNDMAILTSVLENAIPIVNDKRYSADREFNKAWILGERSRLEYLSYDHLKWLQAITFLPFMFDDLEVNQFVRALMKEELEKKPIIR